MEGDAIGTGLVDKDPNKDDYEAEHSESDVPPDGGYGWVIAMGACFIHLICLGLPTSFGVYSNYYIRETVFPNLTNASVSLISSLMTMFMPLGGPFAGWLTSRFGARRVCFAGSTLVGLSLVAASFSTEIWHLWLAQGALVGLCTSFATQPCVAVLPQWFLHKRGVALGIALSGTGAGGLALASLSDLMLGKLGFRWSLRITGIFGGLICMCSALAIRERVPRDPKVVIRVMPDFSVFSSRQFILLWLAIFFASFSYFAPNIYLPSYATSHFLSSSGAVLLAILNGVSGPARVSAGLISDKLAGPINTLLVLQTVVTVAYFAIWLPAGGSLPMLFVFSVLYGSSVGALIVLSPVVLARQFGAANMAPRIAMLFLSMTPGYIIGPIVSGHLLDASATVATDGTKVSDFTGVLIFSGAFYAASTICVAWLRTESGGWKWRKM
ncbi:MFS general substrate transporter [Gonapodya prolifera JEL478]|uniref:MFS general substrate transporter n=1 Tax=Gonapodya prolifera (strain JEL478) TaxID=1344416 RepID=A0A139AU15_GONPJ|nr:MFS general substrate transporter [Gonapodya prolifera JEL478]|eukprot:KXS20197.1 MFS general substrate transporter [Gonapodya prolifera JEL478]